jgi:uncharacterized protein YkwD
MPDTAGRAKELLPAERATRAGADAVVPRAVAGAPLDDVERQVVALTNEERQRARLQPLAFDELLQRAARDHARDMIARGFSDHVNPDGLGPQDRVSHVNRRAIGVVGENLGTASAGDGAQMARRILAAWMGNPSEREIILRPDFTQLGVGIVPAGSNVQTVQVFARTVALTAAVIPASVRKGTTVQTGIGASGGATCDAVDVFSSDTGVVVRGPVPAGALALNVEPGVYTLRFRCGGRMYSGPRLEVTP